jgi:hypothetical protein
MPPRASAWQLDSFPLVLPLVMSRQCDIRVHDAQAVANEWLPQRSRVAPAIEAIKSGLSATIDDGSVNAVRAVSVKIAVGLTTVCHVR